MTSAGFPDPDEQMDQILRERLHGDVAQMNADADLLDRIRADLPAAWTTSTPDRSWRLRRLLPAAAVALVVVAAGLFVLLGNGNGTEIVADGDTASDSPSGIVLEGSIGDRAWSVVQYVEDDRRFVDGPTPCLRIEPRIEPGPLFCEPDELLGEYGRLAVRPARFGDLVVLTGLFAPEVARVRLTIDGDTRLIDPTSWDRADLGLVVVMHEVEDAGVWNADLLDEAGNVLSGQSGDDLVTLRGEPGG